MGQARAAGWKAAGVPCTPSAACVAPEAMGKDSDPVRSRSAPGLSHPAVSRAASRAARAVSPGQVMLEALTWMGVIAPPPLSTLLVMSRSFNSQSSVSLVLQVSHHIMQFA